MMYTTQPRSISCLLSLYLWRIFRESNIGKYLQRGISVQIWEGGRTTIKPNYGPASGCGGHHNIVTEERLLFALPTLLIKRYPCRKGTVNQLCELYKYFQSDPFDVCRAFISDFRVSEGILAM